MTDDKQAGTDIAEPSGGVQSGLEFPIVGIGASAGGLLALRKFFELTPTNTGMAFVVILHLSPKHESTADAVLAQVTRMPVLQVRQPVRIEPDHVYVISPRNDLRMVDGILSAEEARRPRGQPVAVDLFFRTLADTHGDKAVGVVLSGTGSDGALGIARVKEQGGVTLAQLPEDCEYDDMPRNAMATGKVDFVLPVTEMPQRLLQLWDNARRIRLSTAGGTTVMHKQPDVRLESEQALREILEMLLFRCGHDFRHYERATVLRGIERRLQVNMLADLPAYRVFLTHNPSETRALLDDLLISVTSFYRDREAPAEAVFGVAQRDDVEEGEHGPFIDFAACCALGEPCSADAAAPRPLEQPPAGSIEPRLGGLRVLVVEDSIDAAGALRVLLQLEGADVTVAHDGVEGLRCLADDRFDLVLSDIGMPGMDGYEFVANLRQQENSRNLPAIALTGFAREPDIAQAIRAGFDAHVSKPVSLDELVELILRVGKKRSRD